MVGRLATLFTLCLLSVRCSKQEPIVIVEEVKVNRDELTFTQKGDVGEFFVSYSGEWSVQAEGLEVYYGVNMASVRDFTIEPASGKGNGNVRVSLNHDLTESYEVVLTVVGKDSQATVTLRAAVPDETGV
jgi:hypothetical protein